MKGNYQKERRPPRPSLVAFDVDGTLIRHYLRAENGIGAVLYPGGWIERDDTVAALKAFAAFPWVEVIVWSAGGRRWAQEVVDTVGLGEYVDGVYGKSDYWALSEANPIDYPTPDVYFDDNGIGAYGKVWIHVDHDGEQGHVYWTPELYAEMDPCPRCGYLKCKDAEHLEPQNENHMLWELD